MTLAGHAGTVAGRGRLRGVLVIVSVVTVGAVLGACLYAVATGRRAGATARLERTSFLDPSARLGSSLAFSPDGMLLAVAGTFSKTAVYNLATGKLVASLPARDNAELTSDTFNPDGRALVITTDGTQPTQIWNVHADKLEPPLPAPRNVGYYSAVYSPDGAILAASDDAGTSTYLWNVASRRVIAVLSYPNAEISPLAFSPDGRTLAVADGWQTTSHGRGYGDIHLWNVARHRTEATLHDPGGHGIFSIGYSPDGKLLAATDALRVYLWNARTGRLAATITPPGHAILRSLEFSPAGQSIAVTSNDSRTFVWDTATRHLVAVFTDPKGAQVSSLAYSPDGRTLAVSDTDGYIYLWDVSGLP